MCLSDLEKFFDAENVGSRPTPLTKNRQIGKVPRAAGFAEDRRLGKDSMMEYLNAVL